MRQRHRPEGLRRPLKVTEIQNDWDELHRDEQPQLR